MMKLEFWNLMKENGFSDRFIQDAWDFIKTFKDDVEPQVLRTFVDKFVEILIIIDRSRSR